MVKQPELFEVGKAIVTLRHTDDNIYKLVLYGYCEVTYDDDVHIYDAQSAFREWQLECSKTGMIRMVGNKYIPLSHFKEIIVKYESHKREVNNGCS